MVFSYSTDYCNYNLKKLPRIKKGDDTIETSKIFSMIYIIRYCYCDDNKWELFVNNLVILINEYAEDIDLNHIGFPNNWKEMIIKKIIISTSRRFKNSLI